MQDDDVAVYFTMILPITSMPSFSFNVRSSCARRMKMSCRATEDDKHTSSVPFFMDTEVVSDATAGPTVAFHASGMRASHNLRVVTGLLSRNPLHSSPMRIGRLRLMAVVSLGL